MIAIVVPVLRRPHRVKPLMENAAQATTTPHRLLFIASPGDEAEIAALQEAGADYHVLDAPPGPGDYAVKVNRGYQLTDEPFIFTGADDLRFHPEWDLHVLAHMTEGIGVVGTNDLCNHRTANGEHSTHSLVSRRYADEHGTIDGPGKVLAECYPHEWVDDELIGTAKSRGAFAFAPKSVVEHLHPMCGKGEDDDLYRGQGERMQRGRRIYQQRKRRWAMVQPKPAPVSVIVATFGDQSWRELAQRRAVASVHAQRMPPAELIVVHGTSLAQARNEGALKAQSPWLVFLDADDELNPDFLQAMSRFTGRPDIGLLNPAVRFISPDGRPKPVRLFKPKSLDQGNYLVIGTAVRRDLFWKAGGFDDQWPAWEDWSMFRRVVALGGRIVQVRQAVYKAHERMDGRNNTIADKQGLWNRIEADFRAWEAAR